MECCNYYFFIFLKLFFYFTMVLSSIIISVTGAYFFAIKPNENVIKTCVGFLLTTASATALLNASARLVDQAQAGTGQINTSFGISAFVRKQLHNMFSPLRDARMTLPLVCIGVLAGKPVKYESLLITMTIAPFVEAAICDLPIPYPYGQMVEAYVPAICNLVAACAAVCLVKTQYFD